MKTYRDIPNDCWPEYTLYKTDGDPLFEYSPNVWVIKKYRTRLHARIARSLILTKQAGENFDIEIRERVVKNFAAIRKRLEKI